METLKLVCSYPKLRADKIIHNYECSLRKNLNIDWDRFYTAIRIIEFDLFSS